jgi:hypothetical protein
VKHPTQDDFLVTRDRRYDAVRVTFMPNNTEYVFALSHPSEWRTNGRLSAIHRDSHRHPGTADQYDAEEVLGLARALAEREWGKVE